jgi:MFS transporter, Spinster family, sphingosine-1-phosphate transporter
MSQGAAESSGGQDGAQGGSGLAGAGGLLALLTVLNVLNFVDRQLLGSFANFIVPDLKLTDTEFGLLTGIVFLVFYATAGLFMGMLADLVHRPRLIAGAITLWSALTAASGAAVNFLTLAVPRALIGVGESALTPAALSLLADRIPASRLGLATGIYYMGVPLGSGASLLVAGYLGPAIGWRNCFYALGLGGILLAGLMLAVREPRSMVRAASARGPGFGAQLSQLGGAITRSPALVATIAGGVALHVSVGAASAFDQLWYARELGFERAHIAQVAGYLQIGGGVLGNLFGGFIGDWWQRRFKSGRPMLLFWMLLALSPLTILYRLSDGDSPFFYAGIVVGIFSLSALYGPAFATVQELAPPRARATVVAFNIFCLNVIGLGIGITGTGFLVDALRDSGSTTPYTWSLLAFTLAGLLAIPCFFLAGLWFKRDKARIAAAEAAPP